MLEQSLNHIKSLQRRYKDELERTYDELKKTVERNPQLRMQQVKQGQTTIVMQLTVDEAVKTLPEWNSFITNHENQYSHEFGKVIENLKDGIK